MPEISDYLNKVICGDCVKEMAKMDANSIDAIVTDPPYGLEFMGKEWDKFKKGNVITNPGGAYESKKGFSQMVRFPKNRETMIEFQKFVHSWGIEALRVLKPGGHILAFGGTRTYHRLVCALEDAGFEIRDTIVWLYGSGFPKNHDISKAIDKMKGVERKIVGNNRNQRLTNPKVDIYKAGIRGKEAFITSPASPEAKQWEGWGTALKPAMEPICLARKPVEGTIANNVLKYGTGGLNIDDSRITIESNDDIYGKNPHTVGGIVDGEIYGKGKKTEYEVPEGRWPANVILDEEAGEMLDRQTGSLKSGFMSAGTKRKNVRKVFGKLNPDKVSNDTHGDTGGASRFFYCAKASRQERGKDNDHPTVKPIKLMKYLIRLITPPDGIVLDPFIGSGTTGIACRELNLNFIGIEKESEYALKAEKRIANSTKIELLI